MVGDGGPVGLVEQDLEGVGLGREAGCASPQRTPMPSVSTSSKPAVGGDRRGDLGAAGRRAASASTATTACGASASSSPGAAGVAVERRAAPSVARRRAEDPAVGVDQHGAGAGAGDGHRGALDAR